MATLQVAELRDAAVKLLDHLEASSGGAIEIGDDFYWEVPREARYDRYSEPTQLTVGQLSSDVEEVLRIARGQSDPVNYGLVWLGQILRVVGERSPG